MNTIILMCQLASLPVGLLYVLAVYPVLRRHHISWYGVGIWLLSLALVAVWLVTGHQASGDIFDNLVWLYMAVLLATASLAKPVSPHKARKR